jgi:hypothetical protein
VVAAVSDGAMSTVSGGVLLSDELTEGSLWVALSKVDIDGGTRLIRQEMIARIFGPGCSIDEHRHGRVMHRVEISDVVAGAIGSLAETPQPRAGAVLARLSEEPALVAWRSKLRHAHASHARLVRDVEFKHPTPEAIRLALAGGAPIGPPDLRAIAVEELRRLGLELHSSDDTPWKRYWNINAHGAPVTPLIENECRDHLLDRLRDRVRRYGIALALPEARRAEGTRADMLIMTGVGRNLPVEVKRHFHPDVWVAAATQLGMARPIPSATSEVSVARSGGDTVRGSNEGGHRRVFSWTDTDDCRTEVNVKDTAHLDRVTLLLAPRPRGMPGSGTLRT